SPFGLRLSTKLFKASPINLGIVSPQYLLCNSIKPINLRLPISSGSSSFFKFKASVPGLGE
ncbi:hypothetical protein ACOL21_11110, partial [Aliarcobacter butzleri]